MSEANDPTLAKLTLPSRGPGRAALLLVAASSLAMILALGAVVLWSWYGEIEDRVQATHPAALEWSADSVRARLDQAKATADWLAGSVALGDPGIQQSLQKLAPQVPIFSGLVALDATGRPIATVGDAPALASLLRLLETERAVDVGLSQAMAAAELRRQLTAEAGSRVQLVEVGEEIVPIASYSQPGVGSIHGLVSEDGLGAALRVDLLGPGGMRLADAQGRVLASAGQAAGGTVSQDALHASTEPSLSVPWADDDVWTVRSARPVGVLGLTVVADQPVYLAFQSMFVSSALMAVVAAAVLGVCVLAASVLAARQTRKLQVLLDAFRAIARSDFQTRLQDPGARDQLGLLHRAFNAMASRVEAELDRRDAQIQAMSKQNVGFQKQHELLARLSITDGLTQLYNHRYFQDQLTREIKRLTRSGEELSILIIDIDNFKQLNDTYGHAAGDEFLRQLAGILRESVRDTDLLARYGGEEFVIVAVGTSIEGAAQLAEKLRSTVAETSFIVDETKRPRSVTVSVGVAQFHHSRTELFAAADAALYRAKASGKNCVIVADPSQRGATAQ